MEKKKRAAKPLRAGRLTRNEIRALEVQRTKDLIELRALVQEVLRSWRG